MSITTETTGAETPARNDGHEVFGFLRVEGVNLGNFVFDTRDLSTVRGSSLMLLDAVAEVEVALTEVGGRHWGRVVSRGASTGLFELWTAALAPSADAARKQLTSTMSYATFVVDVISASGEFRDSMESLIAAGRWRQMQALALSLPPSSVAGSLSSPACAIDGLRPAIASSAHRAPRQSEPGGQFLCDSVLERRNYGLREKQNFYSRVLDRVAVNNVNPRDDSLSAVARTLPRFAQNFEEIAVKDGRDLDGKMAVFYADGNGFGKIQQDHCTDPLKQSAFDAAMRNRRERLLARFLQEESTKQEWRTTVEGSECVRFETILWGGDECMFVMPAALGWRFATLFFRAMGGWRLNPATLQDAGDGGEGVSLTHAAALVFCQHHSPIGRIRALAEGQMAGFAKEWAGRSRDSMVVVALESFDHLGSGYEDTMSRRYAGVVSLQELILKSPADERLGDCLAEISTGISELRSSSTFPRSQLRSLVRRLLTSNAPAAALAEAEFDDEGMRPPRAFRNASCADARILRDVLLPRLGGPAALWVQLEELWDYARR